MDPNDPNYARYSFSFDPFYPMYPNVGIDEAYAGRHSISHNPNIPTVGNDAHLVRSYSHRPLDVANTFEPIGTSDFAPYNGYDPHMSRSFSQKPIEPSQEYKDTVEATLGTAKTILSSCIRAETVKRLIYTASVVAASPLKEDGSEFKDSMDESCWTPLNLSCAYSDNNLKAYVESKTLAEKEILSSEDGKTLEVVSLVCGLVGGETVLPYLPVSIEVLFSATRLPKDYEYRYQQLRFLEELLGKVPVLHIEDACEAHVFLMEQPSISGRFLCASSYVQSSEIAKYYNQGYSELDIKQEYVEGPKRDIRWGGTRLTEKGFVYKYDLEKTLDDCIKCAKRFLKLPS